MTKQGYQNSQHRHSTTQDLTLASNKTSAALDIPSIFATKEIKLTCVKLSRDGQVPHSDSPDL